MWGPSESGAQWDGVGGTPVTRVLPVPSPCSWTLMPGQTLLWVPAASRLISILSRVVSLSGPQLTMHRLSARPTATAAQRGVWDRGRQTYLLNQW